MALTEPTEDLRWAELDQNDPVSGQPNKSEPPSGKQDYGFNFQETPPRQWPNFLFNGIWKFIEWIKQEINNPGVYGESGLRTAAGKDIGIGSGEVPTYGADRYLNCNEINGSKSGNPDTGAKTTVHKGQVSACYNSRAAGDYSQVNACSECSALSQESQINASQGGCGTSARNAQINASMGGSGANGAMNQINACDDCDTFGEKNQINASDTVSINTNASQAQINASNGCSIPPASAKSNLQINASSGGSAATGNNTQVNACDNCKAVGPRSQVNASENDSRSNGQATQINASNNCQALGPASQINASVDCQTAATGSPAQINASTAGCHADGVRTQVNACEACTVDSNANTSQINASAICLNSGDRAVMAACQNSNVDSARLAVTVLSSIRVKPGIDFSVCGGYNGSGDPLTANRKWELDSQNGNIYGTGTVAGSHTFPDYAEMFENLEPGEIPVGTIVALRGRKVRPARGGDRILGVVSADPQFLGGDTMFTWAKRYLKDEFGQPIYEQIPDPNWKGPKKKAPKIRIPKENPDFDPDRENIPRRQRPKEWSAVALMGQILTRIGPEVGENDFVGPEGRKSDPATAGPTRLECMEITQEYDQEKGYAIGLCLIR